MSGDAPPTFDISLDDLWGYELTPCRVGREAVVLVRIDDAVHAYRDRCPHQGVALSEGRLEGTVLTCRAHHYVFDVVTGDGINPSNVRLARCPVRVDGNRVTVTCPEGSEAP